MLANNIVHTEYDQITPGAYSETLCQIVRMALEKDPNKRPNIVELMRVAVEQIVSYSDKLKEKEVMLNQEIVYLTKKLNQRKPNFDQTMRQTQLVKIDTENLSKIGQDPLVRFL